MTSPQVSWVMVIPAIQAQGTHNLITVSKSKEQLPLNWRVWFQLGFLTPQLSPPKKKCHRKTVTKKYAREIQPDYYKHIHNVNTKFNKPSFAHCMEWWDRKLCDKHTSNTS
jgi:hypothetical protein